MYVYTSTTHMWNEIPKRNPDFKKKIKEGEGLLCGVYITCSMQYYDTIHNTQYLWIKCRPMCKGGDIKYKQGQEL